LKSILHLTPALFGSSGIFGGAERYTFELARHMAQRVETRLVAFGDSPQRFVTEEGLKVEVLGPAWRVRGQEFNRFHPRLVREIAQANVIHCHQHRMLASSVSAILARCSGKRIVASDLGGGGWDISSYLSTDSWYHHHLHISEYSRSLTSSRNRHHSSVIMGGVDIDRFSPDRSIIKEPLVVFVGRLMPHKGINYLIEALPEGLQLELIGRPYQPDYLELLKRLAANKAIRFRHDCSDDEIIHAYRRAIAIVLPSVYRDLYGNETTVPELLGQTLLEGMACGTPAICSQVASMPEVVEHGVTGFCVAPNDPLAIRERLIQLRDNPTLVSDFGRAGRERVLERFTWDRVVDRCFTAYGSSLLSKKKDRLCQSH
jgi:glycosyltransferase involved in cell wall biosynthesis